MEGKNNKKKRVVITGIGLITNIDNSKNKIIYNLKNLKHNFIFDKDISKVIGNIKDFNLKSQQVLN